MRRRGGRVASWRSRDLASARSIPASSGDADELKLNVERFAVERLHHIFVRTRLERGANVGHVVLGRAENDLRLVAVAALAKQAEELHPAHHRHVPVEQHDIGHFCFAASQRFAAIAGFLDFELESFEDVTGDLADHLRVIDDQTALHILAFPRWMAARLTVKGNEELKLREGQAALASTPAISAATSTINNGPASVSTNPADTRDRKSVV